MDLSALSRAAGYTNLASTRNAFNRYKKRYGFGNIPIKTGDGRVSAKAEMDEYILPSVETGSVNPQNPNNYIKPQREREKKKGGFSNMSCYRRFEPLERRKQSGQETRSSTH